MNSAYECIQVQLKKIIIKLKLGYVEIIWAPHKLYDTYYSLFIYNSLKMSARLLHAKLTT